MGETSLGYLRSLMAEQIDIEIKGLERAIAKIGRFEHEGVSSIARRAVERGATVAEATAKYHVPRSPGGSRYGSFTSDGAPGKLAGSIKKHPFEIISSRLDGIPYEMEASVTAGGIEAPYARAVESGSGIYRESINDIFTFAYGPIVPRRAKAMRWRDDMGFWHTAVSVKGQRPQRFMEKSRDEAEGILRLEYGSGRITFDI